MRRPIRLVCTGLALLVPIVALLALEVPSPAGAQVATDTPWPYRIYIPDGPKFIPTATPTPTATATATESPTASPNTPVPPPELEWDERLPLRGATIVPVAVEPGTGYWKVVKGVWYDVNDFHPMGVGDHEIHFDVRDAEGVRQVGMTMRVSWTADTCELSGQVVAEGLAPQLATVLCTAYPTLEQKSGELYAGSYPMYHIAPTYRVEVAGDAPSEAVDGLGMGSITDPYHKVHTSYGFVWHWTIAGGGEVTETPTTAPTGPAGTPTSTPTPEPTTTAPPPGIPSWDPRLTERNAVVVAAAVQPGEWYWRLVSGTWYDVAERPFENQGLILVDTRAESGGRQTGVAIQVSAIGGEAFPPFFTEAKPGEPYAASFLMMQPAPAYEVRPIGAPADVVTNLGLGTLADPHGWEPTRYGFVWQWTIAADQSNRGGTVR